MKFTDSHHHLQDYKTKNTQQIINKLKKADFIHLVCVSSRSDDWKKVAAIAKKNPDMIIPAFGVHPWYIKNLSQNWEQQIEELLQIFPEAQIGECGLDRLKTKVWEGQMEVFDKQIALACRYERPLNIHLLKAEAEFHTFWHKMPKKFMFHSFGGSIEFLKKALDYGAYISLSASFLKRKNVVEIIQYIPFDRLLTETDAPYQTNSSDIMNIIAKIAEIKEVPQDSVSEIVCCNFTEFNKQEK